MDAFANFGPLMTSPPPVRCSDAVLYYFFLEADLSALDGLCTQVFHQFPAKIICTPHEKTVLLVFGDIRRVGNPSVNAAVAEKLVFLQIFVEFTVFGISGYAFFTPFMWVNNPLSMAGGREVFGYPKGLGTLSVPRDPQPSGLELSLTTWVGDLDSALWPPDQEQVVVKQGGDFSPPGADIVSFWMSQLEHDESRSLLQSHLEGDWTEIFLRQLRGIDGSINGQTACFEQIVTARYSITTGSKSQDLKLTEFKNNFDLTIANFDSASIVKDLGLQRLSGVPPKTTKVYRGTLLGAVRVERPLITLHDPQLLWQMAVPQFPAKPAQRLKRKAAKTRVRR